MDPADLGSVPPLSSKLQDALHAPVQAPEEVSRSRPRGERLGRRRGMLRGPDRSVVAGRSVVAVAMSFYFRPLSSPDYLQARRAAAGPTRRPLS